MDKVMIVLSCEALCAAIDYISSPTAMERLQQNNILFTEEILKQYELFFKKRDLMDVFQGWYKKLVSLDVIQLVDEIDKDIYTDIKLHFKNYQFPIYVKVSTETTTPNVKYIENFENINKRNVDCRFNRYCIPSTFIIKKNVDFAEFKSWLAFMAFNEETIVVIDPYIFKGAHPELFEKLYLPILKICPNLKVMYSDKHPPDQSTISSIKRKYKKIKLMAKPHKDMHDRHICSESWNISIDYGLRLFDESLMKSIVETEVSISPPHTNPSISGIVSHT